MRIEMSINKAIEGLKKRLDEIKEQFSNATDSG